MEIGDSRPIKPISVIALHPYISVLLSVFISGEVFGRRLPKEYRIERLDAPKSAIMVKSCAQ